MIVFVRTHNPRPTFHLDMTEEERGVLMRHVGYWSELGRQGIALVFGPVEDPAGRYGIGVFRVDDLEHVHRLLAGDPAHGLLAYDVFEMPRAIVGAPAM